MQNVSWMAVALAALAAVSQTAAAGQFQHAADYKAGLRPYQVVAVHLTNSGNVDLAVANWLSDQLVIVLGDGDGTFQKPLKFSVPGPISLAAGDFNEDGNMDLAVVEDVGTGDGTIAIFLGDGKGGFKLSASYPLGVVPVSVAVADFNGDGHLDVAVTNKGSTGPGNVMTFFGTGHGKLKGRKTYKLRSAFGIAAGDLNGDGHPDLVVAAGEIAVLINDGTGKFAAPVYYDGDVDPLQVTIADLRHNGKQDLVAADGAFGVDVWLNKGDGTFGSVTMYFPGCDCEPPQACTVADFNLDGKLDVACTPAVNSESYLFRGDGKGNLSYAGDQG